MLVRVMPPFIVLTVALVIGSGILHGSAETPAQRAAAIEADVRCPSCTDVSVAQSDQSTALAVRHQIERLVAEGRSAGQIEGTLVSEYGATILLVPPRSDGIPVIWLIPILLGAGTLLTVTVVFWRRARQFAALRAILDTS
jgi:cytochrome c-type biogenesis protein CcmH/NrfF